MAATVDLIQYLDTLLNARAINDYCPNGLQVEGKPTVSRIAVAVTASLATVRAAAAAGMDALIVHHGYFWKGEDPRVLGPQRRRLAALLAADLNLIAYHLPLDLHPEVGNNACLGRQLEWPVGGTGGDRSLVAWTDLPSAIDAGTLAARLGAALAREPLLVGDLSRPLRRIAWCTGAAQDLLPDAVALGADAFVSGEISERTTHLARESGVVYASAGHHATERYGVQALAARLEATFGVETRFIDDPNPV
ncbi:MAG: Nif3-like dinuclear metal center hexameric protein [Lautropia sp.]